MAPHDPSTWGLSDLEVSVMDAFLVDGRVKLIAQRMDRHYTTIKSHMRTIRDKSGIHCGVLLALAWDRHRRNSTGE